MWKTAIKKRYLLGVSVALLTAAPVSLHWTPANTLSLAPNSAEARIGNPLSAGSIAGVHHRADRRIARRAAHGIAAAGAAGAYYGGSNNLYSYAPAASAAPATNSATQEYKYPTGRSVNEGGMGYNVQNSTFPPNSPELQAACINRNFGTCPGH